jgi:glycosyltransferase involved in cell wall biosynthesis
MQAREETRTSVKTDAPCVGRPLVSVGIPTYNRPAGLRRTLECICGQTYSNIEIVVSDNASPDSATKSVVDEFATRDHRIRYFGQLSNIGAMENFRFVLARASGEYFMWAADDDEWDSRFVEVCLGAAGPKCSTMTRFSTVFRARGIREENGVPRLLPEISTFENVKSYLSNMQPSLFYGLHPRKSVLFALKVPGFDFYDCYLVLRLILESGFRTIDQNLYSAGVDTPHYEIKYAAANRRLRFFPFFSHSAVAMIKCSNLSVSEKVVALLRLSRLVLALRRHHKISKR